MKKLHIFLLCLLTFIVGACGGGKGETPVSRKGKMNDELRLKGDHTVYGLACEGCSDSTIILLPNDGGDPVSYDVIDAFRNRQILGKPKVGDWIGLIVNAEDSTVADMVIDLDELKGTWCYVVMPKMREFDHMSEKLQKRMMRDMPDSIKETFMIPREYGFSLKRQWTAQSVGYVQENNLRESPVVYPKLGYFTAWHIWNGKLVMTSGEPNFSQNSKDISLKNLHNDTCDIVFLGNDSLVLASGGQSRSYYRNSDVKNINKKAKEIAEQQKAEALDEIKN